ncbi:MAG: DNA repair protein RadA [Acidobacteria bacterium]|nr:MAG: DNA repair protein RadA [Acidobacteriota bacterium]PYQ68125.1 MAG: DNA repair protein RadA [Acidobacteriota bacterium]
MSPRATSLFACQSCGASSPKWLGRCPECGEWNSYVEEAPAPAPSAGAASARPLSGIETRSDDRVSTGLPGLDRVLGGGLVAGSVVLLGGEPGVGKSTLLLQAARGIAAGSREVLYAAGEESAGQVRLRADRLGITEKNVLVLPETDVERVVAQAEGRAPAAVVVDSIQAVRLSALSSGAGTVSQVRESAARFVRYAKERSVPVLLVGHVTKDGSLAGPKVLEHLVDAVISIDGDRGSSRRILRATKNRFGAVDEVALYDMGGAGLEEVANPSAALLGERRGGVPGSAVTAAREGTRSLLLEVQALVGATVAGSPRRVAIGLDAGRLALLLAVLERAGVLLGSREVFVSCAGGLQVTEPAADLAVVAALVSSARGKPVPASSVFFGEIGLLGEVRRVSTAPARIREAAALGFENVYLPSRNARETESAASVVLRPVERVTDLVTEIALVGAHGSARTSSRSGAGPIESEG